MSEEYLATIRARLAAKSFRIQENILAEGRNYELVASRARFDIVGGPTHLEEFFLFSTETSPTIKTLRASCEVAWRFALQHENPLPWTAKVAHWFLKRSYGNLITPREASVVICVYVVPLAETLAEPVKQWLATTDSVANCSEGIQKGFQIPLAYEKSTGQLHHFEKAPWIGGVFYTEFKKVIAKRLVM